MCNIAGYMGDRPAAPILLEMLRRQAPYDGDMSTGVATVHEGTLYYRKIVGDVDTLIQETDVLSLPGNYGIAHTRPGGRKTEIPYHPFLSLDERIALVTNGTTPKTKYCHLWDEAVDLLDQNGYEFTLESENPKGCSPKLSRNGHHISPAEARVHLVDFYMKQGKCPAEALSLACAHMVSDNVTVMIGEAFPDQIYLLRTTRPMTFAAAEGECFLATTRFGLPEEVRSLAIDLPLHHACRVSREGVTVTAHRAKVEPVAEMTPKAYREGFARLEALLRSDRAPLYFDELEFAADEMRDLWDGDHTYVQHARLVYDILFQLESEGRLKKEIRVQERKDGKRHRYYMWLDD